VSSSQIAEAPLPRSDKPLVFDARQGMRVRK
jgi:hypothetical protein